MMLTTNWAEWREKVWNSMAANDDPNLAHYPGLAPLEQYMARSKKEKRCIECGAPGTAKQMSGGLIKTVPHYWFCESCAAYWERRGRSEESNNPNEVQGLRKQSSLSKKERQIAAVQTVLGFTGVHVRSAGRPGTGVLRIGGNDEAEG